MKQGPEKSNPQRMKQRISGGEEPTPDFVPRNWIRKTASSFLYLKPLDLDVILG